MKKVIIALTVALGISASAAQKEVEAYLDGESAKIYITIRGPTAQYIYNVMSVTAVPENENNQRFWKYGKSIYCVQDATIWDAPEKYECYQLVD